MAHVISYRNADFQACFLESIISKGMHRQLASNGRCVPFVMALVRREATSEAESFAHSPSLSGGILSLAAPRSFWRFSGENDA